jgi:bifunctional DNA-binding transcriptional regulator/antitoxin component of YhaV-PrlF toxin-antitoxin module
MTVTVQRNVSLAVPSQVQRRAGIKVGDQLEFKVSGGIITILPRLYWGMKRFLVVFASRVASVLVMVRSNLSFQHQDFGAEGFTLLPQLPKWGLTFSIARVARKIS